LFERFDTPVKCAEGHLFTTIWMPLASFKAIRLGGRRWQHCPVEGHWTMVEKLDRETADPWELKVAALVHDVRIP